MAKAVLVRFPVELHRLLVERAEQQGVSFNTLVLTLLAGAIKFRLADDDNDL
jgi:predicted HicB family RNase H-like nuclease